MKQSDVKVGGLYSCRVSGRVVPVRVLRSFERSRETRGGWQRVVRFHVLNTRTGRKLTVSGQRLREEVKQRLTRDGLVPTTVPVPSTAGLIADVTARKPLPVDPAPEGHDVGVIVGTGGSLYVFQPLTARARHWFAANVEHEPWQRIGGGIAVEHRFAADLYDGLVRSGLRVSRPVPEGR